MTRYLLTIFLLSFSLYTNATEKSEIEKTMHIAEEQARCMTVIFKSFPSKKEEQIAYSKFYKALVKEHKKYIEFALKHKESDMPRILKYVGSSDILVGMIMQGTIIDAGKYNEKKYGKERARKSISDYNKFVWNANGCDAIYTNI